MAKKCPLCQSDSLKVIYYGLPVRFCVNQQCNCMFGFWFNFLGWLPFNGILFVYEGWYFPALFGWLTDGDQ